MTHNKLNREKNKSTCEKYMQTMMSIIKFSSFSLATMNLGDKKNKKNAVTTSDSTEKFTRPRKKLSQAPVNKTHDGGDQEIHKAYVIYGTDDDAVGDESFSEYMKRLRKRTQSELNKEIINVKSAAYITKFHEKNSRHISVAGYDPLVLPPPPPQYFKK